MHSNDGHPKWLPDELNKRLIDILVIPSIGMARHIDQLKKHYGIVADTKVSKQLIKRIKQDRKNYITQIENLVHCDVTHDPTQTVISKRTVEVVGHKVTKKQTQMSGASWGRSTGAIKKSGANKRSGSGKEHGECKGASTRTGYELTPIKQTENQYKKIKSGDTMLEQVKAIVEAYDQLIKEVQ